MQMNNTWETSLFSVFPYLSPLFWNFLFTVICQQYWVTLIHVLNSIVSATSFQVISINVLYKDNLTLSNRQVFILTLQFHRTCTVTKLLCMCHMPRGKWKTPKKTSLFLSFLLYSFSLLQFSLVQLCVSGIWVTWSMPLTPLCMHNSSGISNKCWHI